MNTQAKPQANGAELLLLKEILTKVEHLEQVIESRSKDYELIPTDTEITEFLHEIGVPAHILGYRYAQDAVAMAIEDMNIMNHVTTLMYPSIAKKHKTTPSKVERAIRHAVELAWSRGNVDVHEKLFGYTINANKGKPTNSEFIATIADSIRINRKKRGEINL